MSIRHDDVFALNGEICAGEVSHEWLFCTPSLDELPKQYLQNKVDNVCLFCLDSISTNIFFWGCD